MEIKTRDWLALHAINRKAGRWGSIRQKAGNKNESRDLIHGAENDPDGEELELFPRDEKGEE